MYNKFIRLLVKSNGNTPIYNSGSNSDRHIMWFGSHIGSLSR